MKCSDIADVAVFEAVEKLAQESGIGVAFTWDVAAALSPFPEKVRARACRVRRFAGGDVDDEG